MKRLLLPLLVAVGCTTQADGYAWEELRDAIAPTPELTFMVSGTSTGVLRFSGDMTLGGVSSADLLHTDLMRYQPQTLSVWDFEGRGPMQIGRLDSAGVFWLDSSLRCNPSPDRRRS